MSRHLCQDSFETRSCFACPRRQSSKFDDQCVEFGQHETLDASGALLTATVDNVTGDISGLSLSSSDTAGVIPLTVPSGSTVRRPPVETSLCSINR